MHNYVQSIYATRHFENLVFNAIKNEMTVESRESRLCAALGESILNGGRFDCASPDINDLSSVNYENYWSLIWSQYYWEKKNITFFSMWSFYDNNIYAECRFGRKLDVFQTAINFEYPGFARMVDGELTLSIKLSKESTLVEFQAALAEIIEKLIYFLELKNKTSPAWFQII